ncbi:hypothetical protein LDO26_06720 [Luteimonas sp. BDR2-5]|uniref:hypothetical protein n=1 Tax=Proluteimonas luteida TaxID=2878685 RepID=UPI001E61B3FD|nr:hypothetical protein [Luteimonas sp. BDR2-5]MCD9027897.1 hypothetical protein [Luteimonas sp. BDR2-5]
MKKVQGVSEETTRERPTRLFAARHLFEILIAFGVLLISAVSVFVAYNANRTQERILAASVWPSLIFGTSNASPDGGEQISLDLLNRGVGPARVRWAEVLYDGAPVSGPSSLLVACCGATEAESGLLVMNSAIQRRVVGADEWIQFMRVRPLDAASPTYEALGNSLGNVRLRLCYCSVLDECWLLDSKLPEPAAVRACPAAPAVLWGNTP